MQRAAASLSTARERASGQTWAGAIGGNIVSRAMARRRSHPRLDDAKVRKFEACIGKSYPGVIFELTFTHKLRLENVIELTRLVVQDRKHGTGSEIMRKLAAFADRYQAEVRLSPASKGDYSATTSRARLVRFYKRFGFCVSKPNAADYALSVQMHRRPIRTS